MKSFSILCNISMEKNDQLFLSRSAQKRRINVYSINAITGERYMFAIREEDTQKTKFEIDMRYLFSLHKKFANEGKSTFVFKVPKTGTSNQIQPEQNFDEFKVFMSECLPSNLTEFLKNSVNAVEYIKKLPNANVNTVNVKQIVPGKTVRSMDIERLPAQTSKNVPITPRPATGFKLRGQELLARLETEEKELTQLRKRKMCEIPTIPPKKQMAEVKDNGQIVITNVQPRLIYKEGFLFRFMGFIWKYLEPFDRRNLALTSKKAKGATDLLIESLIVRAKNPVADIYKTLLKRYKNVTKFSLAKGVVMKFSKDFFAELKLKRLLQLDIAKCPHINDKIINMFILIAPNLRSLKLPYNAMQTNNFDCLIRNGSARLTSLKLKYNLSLKTESSVFNGGRWIENTLENFRELEVFQIYTMTPQCLANIAFCNISLYRLKRLKISQLNLTESTIDAPLLFLSKLNALQSLKITSIKLNRQVFEPDDEWKRRFLKAIGGMKQMSKLTISDFYDSDFLILVTAMLSSVGSSLRKVKCASRQIDDGALEELMKLHPKLEKLDISQCKGLDGSCFRAFKDYGRMLKIVVISFDDHRLNLLKNAIRDAGIFGCRIVKLT